MKRKQRGDWGVWLGLVLFCQLGVVEVAAAWDMVSWGYDFDNQVTDTPGGIDFIAIAGGDRHSLALKSDGSIVSWGLDNWNQVNNTPAGNDFTAIAGGQYHSLALKTDGAIVSWGDTAPAPAGNDFTAIAAGFSHSLALKSDGSIVSWGSDSFSVVTDTPTETGFLAIAGGEMHSLALKADGSIVSWGTGHTGGPPTGTGFTAIAEGREHGLALRSDGSIVSWGRDDYDQVSNTPAGNDFTAIAGGEWHSLALKADGSIVSWGDDYRNQVSNTPAGNDFMAIAGGWNHSLALRVPPPSTPTPAPTPTPHPPVDPDLPMWRTGDTWQYEERATVTLFGVFGADDSALDGNMKLTDWQSWSVTGVGTRLQERGGGSHDVYDVAIGVGSPPMQLDGTTGAGFGTRVRTVDARMREDASEMWFRRTDLALVRRRRYWTGRMEAAPILYEYPWYDIGSFVLDEHWEFSPPLESYDFPVYLGEVWDLDGGATGGLLTVHTWGVYDWGPTNGSWDRTYTLDITGTEVARDAVSPTTGRGACNHIQLTGSFAKPYPFDAQYDYWYDDAVKNDQERQYENEEYYWNGNDDYYRVESATVILRDHSLQPDPAISLSISPETADVGDTVTLSGTGAADGEVRITNPLNGLDYPTTAAGGVYSVNITVPYALDLSTTTYDLSSIGLIATDIGGDYVANTLTITGGLPPTARPTSTPGGPTETPVPTNTLTATPTPTVTPTPTPTNTPSPVPTPALVGIFRDKSGEGSSGDVAMTWVAEVGETYDIYYASAMVAPAKAASPSWVLLDTIVANSNPETYIDTNGGAGVWEERYYTVEVQGTGVYSPTRAGTLPCTVIAKSVIETWQLSILGISLEQAGGNDIQDSIGWQMVGSPDGLSSDEIWWWDVETVRYEKNWLYDSGIVSPYDGTWFDAEQAIPSTDVMALGTGFWAMNRRDFDQTLYVDGVVRETVYGMPIDVDPAIWKLHLLGQPMAADVALTEALTDLWEGDGSKAKGSADGLSSDEIWLWDQGANTYQKNWLYDTGIGSPYDGTWFDAEQAIPTSDVLGRGMGWWFYSAPDAARAGAPAWVWEEPVGY